MEPQTQVQLNHQTSFELPAPKKTKYLTLGNVYLIAIEWTSLLGIIDLEARARFAARNAKNVKEKYYPKGLDNADLNSVRSFMLLSLATTVMLAVSIVGPSSLHQENWPSSVPPPWCQERLYPCIWRSVNLSLPRLFKFRFLPISNKAEVTIYQAPVLIRKCPFHFPHLLFPVTRILDIDLILSPLASRR